MSQWKVSPGCLDSRLFSSSLEAASGACSPSAALSMMAGVPEEADILWLSRLLILQTARQLTPLSHLTMDPLVPCLSLVLHGLVTSERTKVAMRDGPLGSRQGQCDCIRPSAALKHKSSLEWQAIAQECHNPA